MTRGIALLGSCVTRDAFPDDTSALGLTVLSRTGLASLFSPRLEGLRLPATLGCLKPGGFGDRCVRADLEKTGLDLLEDRRPDWLILDFMDERFGLLAVGDSIVTDSDDFLESGLTATAPFSSGRKIERLSMEAWALWLDGLDALRARVCAGPLAHARILLHCSALALRWQPGCEDAALRGQIDMPRSRIALMRVNRLLARQHEMFLHAFPRAIALSLPEDLVVADGAHRWGPAPCHYVPAYYDALASALCTHGIMATPHR